MPLSHKVAIACTSIAIGTPKKPRIHLAGPAVLECHPGAPAETPSCGEAHHLEAWHTLRSPYPQWFPQEMTRQRCHPSDTSDELRMGVTQAQGSAAPGSSRCNPLGCSASTLRLPPGGKAADRAVLSAVGGDPSGLVLLNNA